MSEHCSCCTCSDCCGRDIKTLRKHWLDYTPAAPNRMDPGKRVDQSSSKRQKHFVISVSLSLEAYEIQGWTSIHTRRLPYAAWPASDGSAQITDPGQWHANGNGVHALTSMAMLDTWEQGNHTFLSDFPSMVVLISAGNAVSIAGTAHMCKRSSTSITTRSSRSRG